MMNSPPDNRPLFVISVAASLSGLHPQTLRVWERRGLLQPARTEGGRRRYSTADLARLQRILELSRAGVNVEGIARILILEDHVAQLEHELSRRDAQANSSGSEPSSPSR